MTRTALGLLVGAALLAGVGGFFLLRGKHDTPLTIGPVLVKPDSQVTAKRPTPGKPSLAQRLTTHRVPSSVTVSEGTPDVVRVMAFADAAHEADSLRQLTDSLKKRIAQGDQTAVLRFNNTPKPRKVLPPTAGRYDGKQLTLWVSRSDGSLMEATARLKPRWAFYTGMDKVSDSIPIFETDRWYVRLARQTVHCAPPVGVMAGVGALFNREDRVLGAIVAGGATLLGCLSG